MLPQIRRMCIVTRERLPKEALFRVINQGDCLVYDATYLSPGRGFYVKKDEAILSRFLNENFLRKHRLPPLREGEAERMKNNL